MTKILVKTNQNQLNESYINQNKTYNEDQFKTNQMFKKIQHGI
jgi:hypothetical protein